MTERKESGITPKSFCWNYWKNGCPINDDGESL